MLDTIEADIKANYYDPKMHGMDLDKRFDEARQKIAAAKSQDEALLSIAAAVSSLDDSHNASGRQYAPMVSNMDGTRWQSETPTVT